MADRKSSVFVRTRRRAWRLWKVLRASLWPGDGADRRILLIFGQQRSGTTMLGWDILHHDPRSRILNEGGVAINLPAPDHLRLRPFAEVAAILARVPEPLVVAKPLVESARAAEVLEGLPGSRGVWLYRHHIPNIVSQVQAFRRAAILNLSLALDPVPGEWRSIGVTDAQREVIRQYYSPEMSPHDAAALAWWMRNSLFFEHGHDVRPSMALLRYEDIITRPEPTIRGLYRFLELSYPGGRLLRDIHSSAPQGKPLPDLNPTILSLCEALQARLDAWNEAKGIVTRG